MTQTILTAFLFGFAAGFGFAVAFVYGARRGRPATPSTPPILVGQIYHFKHDADPDNPFRRLDPFSVRVLAVESGWVQFMRLYKNQPLPCGNDALRLEEFHAVYARDEN